MINEKVFEENPNIVEEIDERLNHSKHTIIKYKGNNKVCGDRLIGLLGAKQRFIDFGNAGHAWSFEHQFETELVTRDTMLEYLNDNKGENPNIGIYNSINSISTEEIFELYELYLIGMFHNVNLDYSSIINDKNGFFDFLIKYGIRKQNDKYVIISDELLYEERKNLNEKPDENNEIINKNDFEELFTLLQGRTNPVFIVSAISNDLIPENYNSLVSSPASMQAFSACLSNMAIEYEGINTHVEYYREFALLSISFDKDYYSSQLETILGIQLEDTNDFYTISININSDNPKDIITKADMIMKQAQEAKKAKGL